MRTEEQGNLPYLAFARSVLFSLVDTIGSRGHQEQPIAIVIRMGGILGISILVLLASLRGWVSSGDIFLGSGQPHPDGQLSLLASPSPAVGDGPEWY